MLRSLVGSEMCIRDSRLSASCVPHRGAAVLHRRQAARPPRRRLRLRSIVLTAADDDEPSRTLGWSSVRRAPARTVVDDAELVQRLKRLQRTASARLLETLDRQIYTKHVLCSTVNARRQKTGHRASTGTRYISRSALCCHSNETRASIANPPNSAQLRGTPTIPSSYVRVRAVVWGCGDG